MKTFIEIIIPTVVKGYGLAIYYAFGKTVGWW